MKQNRLLWRIYVYFLSATLVAIAVLSANAIRTLQHFVEKQTVENLTIQAKMVADKFSDIELNGASDEIISECRNLGKETGSRITLILAGGVVIGDSNKNPANMDNHANRPEIVDAFKGKVGESSRFSDTLKKTLKYVAIPLQKNGEILAVARVSRPVADIRWTKRMIIRQILWGTLSVALLFAIVAFYLSRQITRPLEEMRAIAVQLADGNLSSRVSAFSLDEIGALAQAINSMASQLDTRMKTIVRQQVEQNAVLRCMHEGVMAVAPDGKILYLNKRAAKLLNTTKKKAHGSSIQEIVRHSKLQMFITDSFEQTDRAKAEITINENGEHCIRVDRTPLTDPSGWNIGGLVVMNDITQIKRLETMRSDFVANVSHELKTPITALKGCVETLTSDEALSTDETDRFVVMMERHVNRLEAIVEDLLSLSRIEYEMKEHQIDLKPSSVCELIKRTKQNFIKRCDAKNISLKIDCDDEASILINDALLEQAIGNLIDNAIKYSNEETEIAISVKRDKDRILISVSDQGPGIAKRHHSRIFERFYRIDKARSRAFGGTGLGLAIVKHIALAHKGSVALESSLGKGSTFTINLPVK